MIHNIYIKPLNWFGKAQGTSGSHIQHINSSTVIPTFDFSSSATDFLRSPVRAWWEVMDTMGRSVPLYPMDNKHHLPNYLGWSYSWFPTKGIKSGRIKNPFQELVPVRFVANLLVIDGCMQLWYVYLWCIGFTWWANAGGSCFYCKKCLFNTQAIMEADSEAVEDCFPKIFVAMVYWTIIVSGSARLDLIRISKTSNLRAAAAAAATTATTKYVPHKQPCRTSETSPVGVVRLHNWDRAGTAAISQ